MDFVAAVNPPHNFRGTERSEGAVIIDFVVLIIILLLSIQFSRIWWWHHNYSLFFSWTTSCGVVATREEAEIVENWIAALTVALFLLLLSCSGGDLSLAGGFQMGQKWH